MKDFVEIQYSVLWKLCFDPRYFWLAENIIEIKGKQFSKKVLIFYLVETIFFGQHFFAVSRNHCWNKERNRKRSVLREKAHFGWGTTDFAAIGNHFSSPFFGDPWQFFFRLVEKYFSRKYLVLKNGFTLLLIMVSSSRTFALGKRRLSKKSISTR